MSDNKKIQIIYICNDNYKKYSEKFFSTINYFMPGYEKLLTVVTDDIGYFKFLNDLELNNIYIEYYIIPSEIPYPCVNLSKFAYVKSYISKDYDYIFYFDADTYFIEAEQMKWDMLVDRMDNDFLTMSYHTAIISSFLDLGNGSDRRLGHIELSKNVCDERPGSILYDSLGVKDPTHIWIISSFFCANRRTMLKFTDMANKRIKKEMVGEKVDGIPSYNVPRLYDETIANKMVQEYRAGLNNDMKFNIDYFLTEDEYFVNKFPNVLFIQKYATETWNKSHN